MSACMPGQNAASDEMNTLDSAPVSMCTSTSQPYLRLICKVWSGRIITTLLATSKHSRGCTPDRTVVSVHPGNSAQQSINPFDCVDTAV